MGNQVSKRNGLSRHPYAPKHELAATSEGGNMTQDSKRLMAIGKLLEDAKRIIKRQADVPDSQCVAADNPQDPTFCPHCDANAWLNEYKRLLT